MAWHDDYPKFVIEGGKPVEAQRDDEPTHVLMPIGTVDAHEAFYKVVIAERNFYKIEER